MASDDPRTRVRELAQVARTGGDPTGWFETLYAEAAGDAARVPWADFRPDPFAMQWLDAAHWDPQGEPALVVGCGLGDDAEALALRGFTVAAFDVAPTAVAWCRERFPDSRVNYQTADLFSLPEAWREAFALVLEINTLQALPAAARARAFAPLASTLRPDGVLLVIARGRDEGPEPDGPPWPLSRSQLAAFNALGLHGQSFEEFHDAENPPVRRFRAAYRRE